MALKRWAGGGRPEALSVVLGTHPSPVLGRMNFVFQLNSMRKCLRKVIF